MKNERDQNQIMHFAQQFRKLKAKEVVMAYIESTKDPHSYMVFDHTQEIPNSLRLRGPFDFKSKIVKVWVESNC